MCEYTTYKVKLLTFNFQRAIVS